MGTDRCTRTTLVARCCHGAFFGFGFVSTILTLTVMFWIAWCYFGLTLLQISETQRRALVNYSHVSSKTLSTATTTLASRATSVTTQEPLINTISKSPTTDSSLRGSSRGESQVKVDKRKLPEVITNVSKGDFADRVREAQKNATKNDTAPLSKDGSVIPSGLETSRRRDSPQAGPGATAAILSGRDVEESDDRVYARRVLPSGIENRAEDKGDSNDRSIRRNPADLQSTSRSDILPTKVSTIHTRGESSKVENPADRPAKEEAQSQPRDYVDREKSDLPRRDDIQSSRSPDSESVYRDPDFDREYPKRYATSSDRGRYDYDADDERRSRGRYDKRERGRESDDRYPKGDTRVYPDDKVLDRIPPTDEDRYRGRERYSDDIPRRGDDDRYDDRYKDYDEKPRILDNKDKTSYRDRDLDRSLPRNDRYKDDERYKYRDDDDRRRDRDDDDRRRDRDDKYRSRDDDRYRLRDDRPDDDRYRSRGDDRYIPRDDEKYRSRDDDRYNLRDEERYRRQDDDKTRSRDDDRYRYREDERYRYRDDDKYSLSDEDKFRARDDDRYRSDLDNRRSVPSRTSIEEDRYRSKSDGDKYVDTIAPRVRDSNVREPISRGSSALPIGDRKPTSSRTQYEARTEESVTEYDIPVRDRSRLPTRDDLIPSRLSRPIYDDERYTDRDREDRYRSTRYDEDEVKAILPTRTRIDGTFSRSTLIDTKLKDEEESRYADNPRDRIKSDKFYDDDGRDPGSRLQGSRSVVPTSESSRRYVDENERYRTRLPNEKTENSKLSDRREDVVLDRRSYASEEDESYRRGVPRTRDYFEERLRRPNDDTRRRYRDDEDYPRRDEESKRDRPRDEISRDRSKSRDRYDDEYRRYDDKYISRDDDRLTLKEDRVPSSERKYDTYPDDDEPPRRRDSEIRTLRTDDSRIRDEIIRPSASSRDEERFYNRDDFSETKSSSRRYYDDDLPLPVDYDVRDRDAASRRYPVESRPVIPREPILGSSMTTTNSREPTEVVIREKRFQSSSNRYQSSRAINNDRSYVDPELESKEVRPLSAKDVIEAAVRHSDNSDQNSGKVDYPVFNPRAVNLTSSDYIRPKERRGTIITARKRRSA